MAFGVRQGDDARRELRYRGRLATLLRRGATWNGTLAFAKLWLGSNDGTDSECQPYTTFGVRALFFEYDHAAAISLASNAQSDAMLLSPSIFLEADEAARARGGLDLVALQSYASGFASTSRGPPFEGEQTRPLLPPPLLERLRDVNAALAEQRAWAWQLGVMHSRSARGVSLVNMPLEAVSDD